MRKSDFLQLVRKLSKGLTSDQKLSLQRMLKADDAFFTLNKIGDEIFRPARKHGYADAELAEMLRKCGEHGAELIGRLETRYYDILIEEGLIQLME